MTELTDEVLAELERHLQAVIAIDGIACGICELSALELKALIAAARRCRELEKDRDHWKAAHDEMVAHNKLLRNRPDLPMKRVNGYDEIMQQLAAERAKVAKLREALQDAVAGVWDGHYGRGITADYARTVDAKAREALEETR